MCISTPGTPLLAPMNPPLAPPETPFWPPIKRLWSRAVGQFWLSGLLVEGCLELKRLVAQSLSLPLCPSRYTYLYRSPTPRSLFSFAGPSILCSFYACVSTCPEWPQLLWTANVRKSHTHRGISISKPPISPSENVFSRGSCSPPSIDMGCCLLVSGTDFGPNCASCVHLMTELHSGVSKRIL